MTKAGSPWPPIPAVASATLRGFSLQRFAYGPILPVMVQDGWLEAKPAGILGGAIAHRLGTLWTLHLCMLAAIGGFLWFLPWRIMTGFTGDVLIVLAGPAVQMVVPIATRGLGLGSGAVIAEVGIGIISGALLFPGLLPWGLSAVWLGHGADNSLGGLVFGRQADCLGVRHAMTTGAAVRTLELAPPLLSTHPAALAVSAASAWVTVVGSIVLALVRSREMAGDAAARLWQLATFLWAISTTLGRFRAVLPPGGHQQPFAAIFLRIGRVAGRLRHHSRHASACSRGLAGVSLLEAADAAVSRNPSA